MVQVLTKPSASTAPLTSTSSLAAVEPPSDYDQFVLLSGASWQDYQRIIEIRGEKSVPRVCFSEGALQLMSPSRSHEAIKSAVGRLFEEWCMTQGIDITPYGSWTLENQAADQGVEPDECYVIGDHSEPTRPDLAIEVVWSSGGIGKLDIYRKLEVREVWFWKKGQISVYALEGEGYRACDRSPQFPGLDLATLQRYVEIRPMTQAVRAYREALQTSG